MNQTRLLEDLAGSLMAIRREWPGTNQEKRNAVARRIFESVIVSNRQVLGVKPMAEFEPFFRLDSENRLK